MPHSRAMEESETLMRTQHAELVAKGESKTLLEGKGAPNSIIAIPKD